jgi:hypothetical protein
MQTKEQIEKLLAKVQQPTEGSPTIETVLEGTVEVSGALISKQGEELVLSVGRSIIYIPLDSILSIAENESQPAVAGGSVEVTVHLRSDARIKVLQMVSAGMYASRVGMKPLVYDVPSGAPQFAVPAAEHDAAYRKWLEQARLGDFPMHPMTPTFYLTSIPTGRNTSYWTSYQTTTQNADTNTDRKGDSKIDYSADYESDVD